MKPVLFRDVPPRAAAVVVALALLASVVSGSAPERESPPQVREPAVEPRQTLDLEGLERRKISGRVPDLFAPPASTQPPVRAAAVAAVAATPPAPAVPPLPSLPYRYLGRMDDGDRRVVFLENGPNVFSVAPGETLEGTYRVESVGESAVSFRHLARDTVQTLQIAPPR